MLLTFCTPSITVAIPLCRLGRHADLLLENDLEARSRARGATLELILLLQTAQLNWMCEYAEKWQRIDSSGEAEIWSITEIADRSSDYVHPETLNVLYGELLSLQPPVVTEL